MVFVCLSVLKFDQISHHQTFTITKLIRKPGVHVCAYVSVCLSVLLIKTHQEIRVKGFGHLDYRHLT